MANKLDVIFKRNPSFDPVLDALRAISVLTIVAFHLLFAVTNFYKYSDLTELLKTVPLFFLPIWHGEKGVDSFFLISGAVLAIPLFKRLQQFDVQTALQFYHVRLRRIYPLFLLVLILFTAGQWNWNKDYVLSNLFFVSNLIPGQKQIIPVGWSLINEVQYYFLLPFLFFALKRTNWKMSVLLGVIFSSVVINYIILFQHPDLYRIPLYKLVYVYDRNLMTYTYYEPPWTRFGPFVIGLLLAYLNVFYGEKIKAGFRHLWIELCCLLLALIFISFAVLMPVYNPDSFYNIHFSTDVNAFFLAASRQIFAFGLLFFTLGCWFSNRLFRPFYQIFSWPIWTVFSRLSFPIYLLHFPMIAVSAVLCFRTTRVDAIDAISIPQTVLIYIVTLILVVAISIPLHLYVERPFFYKKKDKT